MESAEGFEVESVVTAPILKYNQPGITYTLVQLPEDSTEGIINNNISYNNILGRYGNLEGYLSPEGYLSLEGYRSLEGY